jgi:HEXXH motif-containing protein
MSAIIPRPISPEDQELLAKCSTAIPTLELSAPLAAAVRSRTRDYLVFLLEACEKKLGLHLSGTASECAALDVSSKVSARFFVETFNLQTAMRKGDVTLVLDALQRIQCWDRSTFPALPELPHVTSLGHELWEHTYVEHLRAYSQKNIRGESTIVRPIVSKYEIARHTENIVAALELIRTHDNELFEEIAFFVSEIKLFDGRVLRGDSSSTAFGAIWLRIPEKEDDQVGYWLEHIAHEVSHLRLTAMIFFVPVVLNPASECKYRAPIRDDPRPMPGIMQASFVLARMSRLFRRLSLAGYERRFRDRLQLCNLQLERGIETLSIPEARFTKQGELIRDSLVQCSKS